MYDYSRLRDAETANLLPWPVPRPGGKGRRRRSSSSRSRSRDSSSSRSRLSSLAIRRLTLSRRRFLKMAVLLAVLLLISLAYSARIRPSLYRGANDTVFREDGPPHTNGYARAHGTDFLIHDPSIVQVGDTFYSYSVAPGIAIHESSSLDGPWTQTGSLLDGHSVITKGDSKSPWAPNTIQIGDKFYCYYAVSNAGCRDSAIGVASSDSPGPGGWTDHGLILQSGSGDGSDISPMDQSNAIDANVFVDFDGSAYLIFGSFWTGIWQVKLDKDLVSVEGHNTKSLSSSHLAAEPGKVWRGRKTTNPICGDPSGGHPIEGAFLAYRAPYYYLWYSWGRCCEFKVPRMRTNGQECVSILLVLIEGCD